MLWDGSFGLISFKGSQTIFTILKFPFKCYLLYFENKRVLDIKPFSMHRLQNVAINVNRLHIRVSIAQMNPLR
jgi:hypothetical protein